MRLNINGKMLSGFSIVVSLSVVVGVFGIMQIAKINSISQDMAANKMLKASSRKMSIAMESMAAVTEESSASAEEVSASTEEMTASIEEISAASAILAKMADDLNKVIAKFRL